MKLLITGLSGTLAPKLARAAKEAGHVVLGWDRGLVDPELPSQASAWLAAQEIDAIAHLAMGSADWAAQLACHAAERGLPFVFTSTAMVFDHEPGGPHRPQDARTAKDDYGRYKIACEDAVLAAHPAASVARIGWQIDADALGNNMLAALDAQQLREGRVAASRAWVPACSFMGDTASALLRLLAQPASGVVHLDSNARDAWTFDRLVLELRERFARDWRVDVNEDYRHDQRLVGGEGSVPDLSDCLRSARPNPAGG